MTKKIKLFLGLFFILFSLSVGAQSSTNITIINGFKVTTILTPIGTNVVIPTVNQPIIPTSTNNTTTTAVTSMIGAEGFSTNAQKITGIFLDDFINQLPFYKNGIVNVDAAPIYNFSQHTLGYFGGIDVPTGLQTSLGFGVVDMPKQLDILPLSIKTGLNIDWPYLGEVYHFVSVGSAYNYTDDKLGTYSAFGAVKTWQLSKNGFFKVWYISVGGGISDISTYKGINANGLFRIHCNF